MVHFKCAKSEARSFILDQLFYCSQTFFPKTHQEAMLNQMCVVISDRLSGPWGQSSGFPHRLCLFSTKTQLTHGPYWVLMN